MDSTGPFKIPSVVNNERHLLIFIDLASGFIWDFYLPEITASAVIDSLRKVISFVRNRNFIPKHYHSDGAKSLVSKDVIDVLTSNNMTYSYNSPYTPEDNPHAERSFRTIKEQTLCQLTNSGLPPHFWAMASRYTVHNHNRLPKNTANGFMSPYTFIYNEVPNLSYTRPWGCKAVCHIDKALRRNDWSQKGLVGYFMSYRDHGAGYILYIPKLERFVESNHVFFMNKFIEHKNNLESDLFTPQATPRLIEDYTYLVGQRHLDPDDNLLYVTTRVAKCRGYIVGYRALETTTQPTIELNDPIHIKDIELYTWNTCIKTRFNRFRQPETLQDDSN